MDAPRHPLPVPAGKPPVRRAEPKETPLAAEDWVRAAWAELTAHPGVAYLRPPPDRAAFAQACRAYGKAAEIPEPPDTLIDISRL
jgi:hypothetical protein